ILIETRLYLDDQSSRPAMHHDQPTNGVIWLSNSWVVDENIALTRIPPLWLELIDEAGADTVWFRSVFNEQVPEDSLSGHTKAMVMADENARFPLLGVYALGDSPPVFRKL